MPEGAPEGPRRGAAFGRFGFDQFGSQVRAAAEELEELEDSKGRLEGEVSELQVCGPSERF